MSSSLLHSVRCSHARALAKPFSRPASTVVHRAKDQQEHPHKSTHRLCTGVVLNRAPILTPWGTPFERSYWKYQARIARALSNPFPYNFYFPPGSLHELKFRQDEFKRDAWSFGREYKRIEEEESKKARQNQLLLAIEEEQAKDVTPELKVMSRTHSSDLSGDVKDLNRAGERNLYLVLRERQVKVVQPEVEGEAPREVVSYSPWRLPESDCLAEEQLIDSAKRAISDSVGVDMDTWFVAPKPIGFANSPRATSDGRTHDKIFFLKAHILAGQCKPLNPSADFAWLTKDELAASIAEEKPQYWASIKDMLSDH